MANSASGELSRIVHVVDSDHRKRAQIAMTITQGGGHVEIYENLSELLRAKPQSGTILTSDDVGGMSAFLTELQDSEIFLPVIAISVNPKPSQVVRAAHEGVSDYLAWPFSAEELWEACTYCHIFMDGKGEALMRRQKARNLVENLSPRERQVLAFILEGHSNKSIAHALDLSPRSVEDYRLNAIKKLGVTATSAAIRIGLEAGLDYADCLKPGKGVLRSSLRS